jgi:SET domain-containing protein
MSVQLFRDEHSVHLSYLLETTGGNSMLEVKKSNVFGAGQGLFVKRPVVTGQVLCSYTGDVLRTKEAIVLDDKSYLMRLGPEVYVDARNDKSVLARFINDCRDQKGYNVRFVKLPGERCALIEAIRNIEPGEELYVNYGRFYWFGKCPSRLR